MNIFEGTHIKLDLKRYPNQVFFFKEDVFWMEYNWKNGYLGCKWKDFWETLKKENKWDYDEGQTFIKKQVEEHFKLKGVTPIIGGGLMRWKVEEHFKLKGVTPYFSQSSEGAAVEEHFKLKGIR